VVRAIQKNGVRLREVDGKSKRVRVRARKGPARLTGVEVLVVAVKSYDTRTIAVTYRGRVPSEATILTLQNGLGNVETLSASLRNELLAGSTTEGALSLGPGSVLHTGKGLTIIGDPQGTNGEACSRVRVAFESAGFRTRISSNIRGVLWTKAIVNAAINPLSSLTKLPNGALLKNADLLEIAQKAILEGIAVSRAAGIKLSGDPRKLWRRILLSTGANRSSMLQDIERGKMTEIRQLNGALVAFGEKARIKTPVNSILTKLVMGLEASSTTMMRT
jgi:2-dehydropantoate 2-reductase